MKRFILFVFILLPFISRAQSYVQVGPAVYPMGAWGGEFLGDFHVANFTPKLSFSAGAMAFANTYQTHDEPEAGNRVYGFYLAPQVGLHYAFSGLFECYLRGGAGLSANKKSGGEIQNGFLYNGVLGVGFSIWSHLGFYVEAGLPYSSLGLRIAL